MITEYTINDKMTREKSWREWDNDKVFSDGRNKWRNKVLMFRTFLPRGDEKYEEKWMSFFFVMRLRNRRLYK